MGTGMMVMPFMEIEKDWYITFERDQNFCVRQVSLRYLLVMQVEMFKRQEDVHI